MLSLSAVIRLTAAAVIFGAGTLAAAPAPTPAAPMPDRHLGVADCAGSTCHGSTRPFADRRIRQDEYFIWQRKDRHGEAFETLLGERSRRITANLGWGAPQQAEGCLVCHAHAPPAAIRGPRFLVEDGIGCEACHGAAERWIAEHVNGLKTSEEKIAHGMTATWDAGTRGRLCSSCHLGDSAHPMTHAIMAAGHPPLLFELDTFTALEPPHWDVDADYRERKPAPDTANNWLEGQLAAADAWLGRVESGALGHGLFPELALFDCDACHHSMEAGRWRAARTPGRAPGQVPLADQPLVLLQAWATVMAPAAGGQLSSARQRLYRQYEADAAGLRAEATQLRRWLRAEGSAGLRAAPPTAAQLRRVLAGVINAAQEAQGGDFYYAQQTAMASQVLAAAISERGGSGKGVRRATDSLYDAVKHRDRFELASYRRALGEVAAALR
jgi:hypothetical protein